MGGRARHGDERARVWTASIIVLALIAGAGLPAVQALVVPPGPFPTQTLTPQHEGGIGITPGGFGSGIDVEGEQAIVAATSSFQVGDAAFVYTHIGFPSHATGEWEQAAKLDSSSGDPFAQSVAIGGGVAAVGAASSDARVEVFTEPDDWSREQILRSPTEETDDGFGRSVDIDGGLMAVGEPGYGEAGAVHVFEQGENWTHRATLTPQDPEPIQGLGSAVAIDGGTVAAGAPSAHGGSGAVLVFTIDEGGTDQVAHLTQPIPLQDLGMGRSVGLDGSTVIAGAPGPHDLGVQGLAYVFEETPVGWSETAVLRGPDPFTYDQFGRDVDIDGDTAVVSDTRSLPGEGAGYLYLRTGATWSFAERLQPQPPQSSFDQVGYAVGIDEAIGSVFVSGHGDRVDVYQGLGGLPSSDEAMPVKR